EGVEECVPLRVDLDAAVLGKSGPQEPAVLGQRLHITFLPQLFDQPRRALDVCEQQGDGAGRKIHTHGSRSSAAKDRASSPPAVPASGHSAARAFGNESPMTVKSSRAARSA